MAERRKETLPEQEQTSIHGDILESVFGHVPLIDLVPASRVSKSWKRSVSTSLRYFNKIKPWLILHSQATRSPHFIASHAYDPRSHVWIQIQQLPIHHVSALRSSHSTLLYMLSPSKFSFSFDPLHLTWHHVESPLVWRTDPIVAVVGHRVIVAGGACDFEDDPLAVEIYDLKTRTWDKCESMPTVLKDSAASTWLSIAVNGNRMYVAEKSSGLVFYFDPETKSWNGPYNLRPNRDLSSTFIGFSNDRLILVGLTGDDEEEITGVKLWELNVASFDCCREIGEMPKELVEKMREDSSRVSSVVVNVMGDFVYINNACAPGEVFLCELGSGACKWNSVRNVVVNDKCRLAERSVFSCANVGLDDLNRAILVQGTEFSVVGSTGERL
ncbi:hypothetical protein JCGZ_17778 [Jatropha curcas]|uniref:F-box domain-containing protein n=1 Tax=Jatropha curcas TaxID=180498 RepID=A0A067K2Z4_JATCU|nr:F-box/kelch-repeat protein At1g23390 [Jatropha curcas]KDP26620.1 hypothetical protein JCGZ_17778 [Jatropha curcas]